ncbi:hypothetical protein VTH82DRAFT_400 [Thermothelomyces myriococcoides]
MYMWLSTHGATAINGSDDSFVITAKRTEALVEPRKADQLIGTILFPLPCLPRDVSRLVKVEVDFSSQTAYVTDVALMSGNDVVFQQEDLEETEKFKVRIYGKGQKPQGLRKGMLLAVGVTFNDVDGSIRFHSAGLKVETDPVEPARSARGHSDATTTRPKDKRTNKASARVEFSSPFSSPSAVTVPSMPVQSVRVATGHWNVTDVRPRDRPTDSTSGYVKFPTPFSSPPSVMVSLTGVDVSNEADFRVRVYATGVSGHGFHVHADTWGGTTLYSCEVSWLAIGC